MIVDPQADVEEAEREYGITFDSIEDVKDMDAVLIAVGHDEFMKLTQEDINRFYKDTENEHKVLLDIKAALDRNEYETAGYKYWRL